MSAQKNVYKLNGVPASPGIAIGKAFVLAGDVVKVEQNDITYKQVQEEINKFKAAIKKTKSDLNKIQSKTKFKIGKDGEKLFDVYQMLLEDSLIIDETINRIAQEKKNADFIYYTVMRKFQESLESSNDELFIGRVTDIRDVKRRVLRNIQGKKHTFLDRVSEKSIIVARELTPLDTVQLDKNKVLAYVTDLGGKTSHAAIMAQSLQIPSVVGLNNISFNVQTGDHIIVDGKNGEVTINPSEAILKKYKKLQEKYYNLGKKLERIKELPCRTLDGKDVELSANLEFPDELDSVITYGAKGIGLYRSEYLYLKKDDLPTEEEEYEEYYKVASRISPDPVIIRTLDIGGDKKPPCINIPEEKNPFLGLRAIRLCLERQDIFRTQLRAILRASVIGNIKILLPMICCIQEIIQAKKIISEVQQNLKQEKIPFDESIDIGVMIEVPSAAIIADLIAKKVDFLSIGTNDLIQYTLALDRGNERISHLYRDLPLSVLRIIKNIVDAGHEQGVWVGMCGEMAGSPLATLVLLGMGLDELSVAPAVVPKIKSIIRSVTFREAQRIAEKALQQPNSKNVENFMLRITQKRFKDYI